MIPRTIDGKVLVVDNDASALRLMGFLLKKFYPNVETHIVQEGETALKNMEKFKYDIVIIDHILDDMNGDELASMIKSTKSSSFIIMITAEEKKLAQGRKENEYDFIDKTNGFVSGLANTLGVYLNLSKIRKKTLTMVERLEHFAHVS